MKAGFPYKSMLRREFRGYNRRSLLRDALAGMTVGAVALPLALAFGAASVDDAHLSIGICGGLITAVLAGIITGLLGGGSFQISGPTGAMTVILGGIVSGQYGLSGMFLATFLAGAMLLLAGLLHLGALVRFIPRPVVAGFTSGIAIVIALGQLGNFFGVSLQGETTIGKTLHLFSQQMGEISLCAVLCSVAAIVFLFLYPKKWGKYLPGSLALMVVLTAVTVLFDLPLRQIGDLPRTLLNEQRLLFPAISREMLFAVLPFALTIALLGAVESLLCGACAANMKKEPFDSDIELIAQGIGNMVIPLFGGVPSTAAIARTSVAVKNGGVTRLTSLFQSLFLLICMFALTPAIARVPYTALAGVLMVTAWRMNDWTDIRFMFSHRLYEAITMFLVTMAATVLLDLTYAILLGVCVALVFLCVRFALLQGKLGKKVLRFSPLRVTPADEGLFCSGVLFFGNAERLTRAIAALPAQEEAARIDLSGIRFIDISAAQALRVAAHGAQEAGRPLHFCGVHPEVHRLLLSVSMEDHAAVFAADGTDCPALSEADA